MKYLSLDTCVWLRLIRLDLFKEFCLFEEICFWIEGGHILHITPVNIIREWDRNKVKEKDLIVSEVKTYYNNILRPIRKTIDSTSSYEPDINEEVLKRVGRVDNILKNYSELASENDEIYRNACDRNLKCLPPNHAKDSFRDTVNILSLLNHLKLNEYKDCIFSTSNFKDFSGAEKKHELHPQLKDMFWENNLQYIYSGQEDHFGQQLFNSALRPSLPSYSDHIKKRKTEEENNILAAKKSIPSEIEDHENADKDFLENIQYIDAILKKNKLTSFDIKTVKDLTEMHKSYKQYFLKNLGNNGLV